MPKTDTDRRKAARRSAKARQKAALQRKRQNRTGKKAGKTEKRLSILWIVIFVLFLWVLVGAALHLVPILREHRAERQAELPDWVDVQIIDVNGKARRGERLDGVRDIVIHYVGNPGTTAQENRSFFNQPDTTVSAHFLVGLDGEVIQCIPLDEKSSASNDRNNDTLSVEVCHPGADGAFTEKTYQSLVKLTAWLCQRYGLDSSHVIRHYDVTGKACPLYFVENPDAWAQFLMDVERKL